MIPATNYNLCFSLLCHSSVGLGLQVTRAGRQKAGCIRKGPLGLLVFSVPFSPSGPTLRQSSVVSSDVIRFICTKRHDIYSLSNCCGIEKLEWPQINDKCGHIARPTDLSDSPTSLLPPQSSQKSDLAVRVPASVRQLIFRSPSHFPSFPSQRLSSRLPARVRRMRLRARALYILLLFAVSPRTPNRTEVEVTKKQNKHFPNRKLVKFMKT